MKIIFIFSCSGMFRDVPECSVFRVLSTAQVTSLRSIAVLSEALLSPRQSLCGFSALARLYYFARPTKTTMLRRLASYEFLKLTSTSNLLLKLNCIFYNSSFIELNGNLQG